MSAKKEMVLSGDVMQLALGSHTSQHQSLSIFPLLSCVVTSYRYVTSLFPLRLRAILSIIDDADR